MWSFRRDVKLGFLIGLILGWPKTLVAAFLAFLMGAVLSVILILLKKKNMKSKIPFGPFLIVGVLLAVIYGEVIWGWYLGLI